MRTGYLTCKAHWVNDPIKGGKAVIATALIRKLELVALWGGIIIEEADLVKLTPEERGHTLQVDEGLFMAPINMDEPADYINHSCEPNCGINGQIGLVAMRDILPGEEITFDYAMSDSSAFDEFDCSCGSKNCRQKVTGRDWLLPELQAKYRGYFSTYLQAKIDKQ